MRARVLDLLFPSGPVWIDATWSVTPTGLVELRSLRRYVDLSTGQRWADVVRAVDERPASSSRRAVRVP